MTDFSQEGCDYFCFLGNGLAVAEKVFWETCGAVEPGAER